MVRGENHACVTSSESGKVEIWCYGRADAVANGKTDDSVSQTAPSAIKWDPANFERTLQ
jgi:hypothetical protein